MLRIAASVFSALAVPASASTWTIDNQHSNIGFTVRHLVTRVSGSFNLFSGTILFDDKKPEASKVSVTINLDSIFTANQQRDDHLRSADFFDTKKHPSATFESTRVVSVGRGNFKIEGNLSLHGQTRPVSLDVEYLGTMKDLNGNNRGGFTARTKLNRKDFGLTWNKITEAGNVVLGEEVELAMNIAAIETKPQEARRDSGVH